MGLCIELNFSNGDERNVHMRYSSFSTRVMSSEDMKQWGFNDQTGFYTDAKKIQFLISRLITAGFLEADFNRIPESVRFS